MKEIHGINFIRLGVGKALTAGVMQSAKYGVTWEMLTLQELKPLYVKLTGFLKETPYGEFYAVSSLFGEDIAMQIAKEGDIYAPPSGGRGNVQGTSGQGNRLPTPESE
jgi:hypothetical protein